VLDRRGQLEIEADVPVYVGENPMHDLLGAVVDAQFGHEVAQEWTATRGLGELDRRLHVVARTV
jgi:hypothetical protein